MDLPEIPSEFIEPYAQKFLMQELEGLAYGFYTPDQVRISLKEVETFITRFSGIHARYAVMNEFNNVTRLDNETMISIAKETFKEVEELHND